MTLIDAFSPKSVKIYVFLFFTFFTSYEHSTKFVSQIACKYDDKNTWITYGKFIAIIVTPKKLSHRKGFVLNAKKNSLMSTLIFERCESIYS